MSARPYRGMRAVEDSLGGDAEYEARAVATPRRERDPIPMGARPPLLGTLTATLQQDYAEKITGILTKPSFIAGYGPPPKPMTPWRRARRIALEVDARLRMAWGILMHGEHPY